jgi:hypothetical protein
LITGSVTEVMGQLSQIHKHKQVERRHFLATFRMMVLYVFDL